MSKKHKKNNDNYHGQRDSYHIPKRRDVLTHSLKNTFRHISDRIEETRKKLDIPYHPDDRRFYNPNRSIMENGLDTYHQTLLPFESPPVSNPHFEQQLFTDSYRRRKRICKTRSDRRRELFKRGKAGKGIKGPIFRQLTIDSLIRCK